MKTQIWYVLRWDNEEMYFNNYDALLKYWKLMPTEQALKCTWEVKEV